MKQKLYQELLDAHVDYFRIPVGRQQKKWDRLISARNALTVAKLPPFRKDLWTREND